jgi:hypothetical protein
MTYTKLMAYAPDGNGGGRVVKKFDPTATETDRLQAPECERQLRRRGAKGMEDICEDRMDRSGISGQMG